MADKEAEISIFDSGGKKPRKIDSSDVHRGKILADVEGEGTVWVDPSDVAGNKKFQHSPFDGKLRNRIVELQRRMRGVREMSYTEWENEFRCDMYPEEEIAVWEHLADVYQCYSKLKGKAYCEGLFRLLITCSLSDEDNVKLTFQTNKIPPHQIGKILKDYYGS